MTLLQMNNSLSIKINNKYLYNKLTTLSLCSMFIKLHIEILK